MASKTREEQLNMIQELEGQITSLRTKFRASGEEAVTWAQKRDALNARSRKLWEEVKDLKGQRDELNEKIKKLKEERTKLNTEVIPKRQELEALRKKMDDLPLQTGNMRFIAKRIEELDWQIQTNSLTPTQEKELISRIKVLEEQMLACKENEVIKDKHLLLRASFSAIRIAANSLHEKIVELAKHSQELHEKMLEKIKEAEALKPEADEAHQKFSNLRSQADEAHKCYSEAVANAKAIRLQIRQEQEKEEKSRIESAMTVGTEEAIRKLKEKRKITLDEFKILKNKGLI
ncbi:hypothetical protein MUP37_06470 [Candidatus Bathyarchaeota archaeon]|nr:hypothetical protein [Candidatus Bathyarchaeota archaeon]